MRVIAFFGHFVQAASSISSVVRQATAQLNRHREYELHLTFLARSLAAEGDIDLVLLADDAKNANATCIEIIEAQMQRMRSAAYMGRMYWTYAFDPDSSSLLLAEYTATLLDAQTVHASKRNTFLVALKDR